VGLQISFMPTLTELAQLGKQALLAFVAQLLTEFAALKTRVEELLAELSALNLPFAHFFPSFRIGGAV
jgi:hypothetical protein